MHALDVDNPILPPFSFMHFGVTYHVFADLRPEKFPLGADFDVFLPGALDSVRRVHLERGDLVVFVRHDDHSRTIRQGCRVARAAYENKAKHAAGGTLVGKQALIEHYRTPDGLTYWVLLDVDRGQFPKGLTVSVCATGEVVAFPAVGIPADDILLRIESNLADQIRPGFVASYQAAMKLMQQQQQEREARDVRG
jgi:hypothetical protein